MLRHSKEMLKLHNKLKTPNKINFMSTIQRKAEKTMDFSSFTSVVIVLAAWFILSRWVLPWFGLPTCMSGCCSNSSCATACQQSETDQSEKKSSSSGDVSG